MRCIELLGVEWSWSWLRFAVLKCCFCRFNLIPQVTGTGVHLWIEKNAFVTDRHQPWLVVIRVRFAPHDPPSAPHGRSETQSRATAWLWRVTCYPLHLRGFVRGLTRADTGQESMARLVTIRQAKAEDCKALARIWEAGWQQVGPAPLKAISSFSGRSSRPVCFAWQDVGRVRSSLALVYLPQYHRLTILFSFTEAELAFWSCSVLQLPSRLRLISYGNTSNVHNLFNDIYNTQQSLLVISKQTCRNLNRNPVYKL